MGTKIPWYTTDWSHGSSIQIQTSDKKMEQDNSSYSQERTSMKVFTFYILKGKQYENKKFSIIVSSLHEQNLDAYPFTILTMRRRIKRVKEKREFTQFGLELPS